MGNLADGQSPTRVRERREAAGLSQQALASKAGISMRTLSRIEAGEDVRLGTLRMLAVALDCPIAALVEVAA